MSGAILPSPPYVFLAHLGNLFYHLRKHEIFLPFVHEHQREISQNLMRVVRRVLLARCTVPCFKKTLVATS